MKAAGTVPNREIHRVHENRRMERYLKYIIFLTVLTGMMGSLSAQERIDKEIVVVKPYQPSLTDAFKINVLPMVSDSISIRPSFDYSIQPKKISTRFDIRPITPARMVATRSRAFT